MSHIDASKRQQFESKANDHSNQDQTLAMQREISNRQNQQREAELRHKQQLGNELAHQADLTSAEKQRDVAERRYQERVMPGLHFECYERDPQMKHETIVTGKYQVSQSDNDHQKAMNDLQQRRQVAESHLTDNDLARLRQQAADNNHQRREELARNNQYLFQQSESKQNKTTTEKQRQINEEKGNHERMRQMELDEKEMIRLIKRDNGREATQALNYLDQKKRQQFEAKRDDKTNLLQTVSLQEEISHRAREAVLNTHSTRKTLSKDLSSQAELKQYKDHQDKVAEFQGDIASTGIEFECYTRDPIVREEKMLTRDFQKGQRDAEHQKKVFEKQHEIAPQESTLSDLQLDALRHQAEESHQKRRSDMNHLMKSQYHNTINSKIERRTRERRDEEMAAQVNGDRIRQAERDEQDRASAQKRAYERDLDYQVKVENSKKQAAVEERRYDPNLANVIAENNARRQQIIKCGDCSSTLGKQMVIKRE